MIIKKIAIESGGLLVIGTERHESRRIDNQLGVDQVDREILEKVYFFYHSKTT